MQSAAQSLAALISKNLSRNRFVSALRCQELFQTNQQIDTRVESINWTHLSKLTARFQDRFGQCGIVQTQARRKHYALLASIVSVFAAVGAWTLATHGIAALVAGFSIGAYFGLLFSLLLVKQWQRKYDREILFYTPLALESLVLLVQSGLGVLPAMHEVVKSRSETSQLDPVTSVLRLVYDFCAHGMPLGHALSSVANLLHAPVLRHVLLHLDIAGNEGGELVPALQSLSNYAHTQWKLSVEGRVRQLENMVVFPVFASVIGLLLLVSAGPLVPVLELQNSIPKPQHLGERSLGEPVSYQVIRTEGFSR